MTISDQARATRRGRWAFVALIVVLSALHLAAAARRSAGLLEHDEAISVLTAAGQMPRLFALHQPSDSVQAMSAAELQALLRPSAETTTGDVLNALLDHDQHPPLYFLMLRGLLRLEAGSPFRARLFGTVMLLIAAWAANRWIWPRASAAGRWVGLAWLVGSVVMVEVATELRQYAVVILGTTLSVAALVMLWEEQPPRRRVVVLLTLAPALLLWAQYGTVVWVAVGMAAILVWLAVTGWRRWPTPVAAAMISGLLLSPLAWWRLQTTQGFAAASSSLADVWHQAGLPLCEAVQGAWLPAPWFWQNQTVVMAGAAVVVLLLITLAGRGMPAVDRALVAAALAWGGLWVLLLYGGWVPIHAVQAKYLAPLIVVPLVVLVRASAASRPRWVRWLSVGFVGVSLVANAAAWGGKFGERPDAALLVALAETRCLMTDSLSRGYVLPLVEKLPPDAVVLLAPPGGADRDWASVQERLPREGLMLVEVHRLPNAPRMSGMARLLERLASVYESQDVIWSGPRRRIMTFTGRRPPPAAEKSSVSERSAAPHEGERPGA